MRFLADESCDFAAVRALRSSGHDVVAVGEFQTRSVDADIIEMAYREERIVTEDKDFGWLAFVARVKNPGVVLTRFPAPARGKLGESVIQLATHFGAQLRESFVVLLPGAVRISRPPA